MLFEVFANLGGFTASLKKRNLPFIWVRVKNEPWRLVMLERVKLEWETCFWGGDKKDILQRRPLKDSVVFLKSQGVIQSRWDGEGGGSETNLIYQLFSTSDLQSHRVAVDNLGWKVTALSFTDALVLIFPAYARLLLPLRICRYTWSWTNFCQKSPTVFETSSETFLFSKPAYFGQNWIKGSFTWAELRWGWGKGLSLDRIS